MRRLALAVVAAGLIACGPTLAPKTQPLQARAAPAAEAQLFSLDKGFMFPLANGSRVPIANGWIEPRFAQLTPQKSADLDVLVGADPGIDPETADVTVSYEMLEMAHGAQTLRAEPAAGGHHLAHIPMGMYGTWRISVRVVLGGTTSIATLVLAGTGL